MRKKETPDGVVRYVVSVHRELKVGTLSDILRQAEITPEEFIENLQGLTTQVIAFRTPTKAIAPAVHLTF